MRMTAPVLSRVSPIVKLNGAPPVQLSSSGELDPPVADAVSSAIEEYLGKLRAGDMRQKRLDNPWLGAAVNLRRDQVANAERLIGPQDAKEPWDQKTADLIRGQLEAPNLKLKTNTWGGLLCPVVEDMLVISNGAFQVRYSQLDTPLCFKPVDGSRVVPANAGWDPYIDSRSNLPRWLYKVNSPGGKDVPLRDREMVVLDPNPVSYMDSGLAPMMMLGRVLEAELDTFRRMHIVQKRSNPEGVFITPGARPGTPQKMRMQWDMKVAGRSGVVFMNLPADSKFLQLGSVNLVAQGAYTFYEILVRATASAFRTTPFHLGWQADVNRATSESNVALVDEGIYTLLRFIRDVFKQRVIPLYGPSAVNLGLQFPQIPVEDISEPAESLRAKAGPLNPFVLDEIRKMGGHEPMGDDTDVADYLKPFYKEPVWPVGNGGFLPITYAAERYGITKDNPHASPPPQPVAGPDQAALTAQSGSSAPEAGATDTGQPANGKPGSATPPPATTTPASGTEAPVLTPAKTVPAGVVRYLVDKLAGDEDIENGRSDLAKINDVFGAIWSAYEPEEVSNG